MMSQGQSRLTERISDHDNLHERIGHNIAVVGKGVTCGVRRVKRGGCFS